MYKQRFIHFYSIFRVKIRKQCFIYSDEINRADICFCQQGILNGESF
ncbi:hypothetical protein BvCmsSINP049_01604 [Escherichia coli]|nr:hypothetical protein BvCmsSINP049_01604 [Escherichia coli]